MLRSTKMLIVLAVLVSIAAVPALSTDWNLATDWSFTTSQNGQWTYAYAQNLNAGYTIIPMSNPTLYAGVFEVWYPGTADLTPLVCKNATGSTQNLGGDLPAGKVALHPSGINQPAVVRWTAPSTGNYLVNAAFRYLTTSGGADGTDAHIIKNASVSLLSGLCTMTSRDQVYAGLQTLTGGDTLDFCIGYGVSSYGADITQLDVTITSAVVGTIAGTVTGSSGAVAGATVAAGTYSATTASDGSYTLVVPVGTYTLNVTKAGFKSKQVTDVVVSENATTTENVTLIAPNWVQVGSTFADTYASPDVLGWNTLSDPIGDMPADLAIAGTTVPNLKVTYHMTTTGVSGWGEQWYGRHGIGIYAPATPYLNDGLYGGTEIGYNHPTYDYFGAMTGNTGGQPAPGPAIMPFSSWTARPEWDVTTSIIDGAATTTAVVTSQAGVPDSVAPYSITSADITNWLGQNKFIVFKSGNDHSRTFVSNIKFYKDADQVLPHGTIQGNVTLNGSGVGAGAVVATTSGSFSIITDSAGHYSLTMPPGSYTLRASKNGFASQDQGPISLGDGQTITQNFDLTGPNWVQAGPTVTTTYATPDTQATGPQFSEVGQMPITLEVAGGVMPNMKVTYSLSTGGITGWGNQPNGNAGLALFVPATPTTTAGLFAGVRHPSYGQSSGAMVSNFSEITTPAGAFAQQNNYDVTVEVVNGTAWTTLTNINTGAYTVTSTDITNWTGNLGFAAYKCGPGENWEYSRTWVSNITFYRDANQTLTNAGFVSGRVTSNLPGNPPIAGAKIDVMGEGITTYTDSAGNYELTLRVGDYTLRTQATGYATQEPTVHVTAAQTLVHDVMLIHGRKWDLVADYSTSSNPNGQWSYGYSTDLGAALIPFGQVSQFDFMQPVGSMKSWTRDAGDYPNPWYSWIGKNQSGSPVYWNIGTGEPTVYNDYGYVENNEMTFGGGGGWWNATPVGAVYPRIRWTSPDERMVKVYFKIAGQSPTSKVGYLTVAKNSQPAAVKSIEGFVGRAASSYTDSVGPAPTATFETQLLVSTGDTIDFMQGRYQSSTGWWIDCFGYPWASMAIWATIEDGDAQICNTWADLMSKNVGDTVYMKTPVQLASATNEAGSFDKKFGNSGVAEYVFYVQNADRTQGIKCISDGTLSTYDPKYKIVFTGKVEVDPLNTSKKIIRILSVSNAVLGTEPGPLGKGSKALTNSGTLVKVWGKITSKTVNPNAWSDLWDADTSDEGVNMQPKYDYEYITINDGGSDVKILMHVQATYMTNVDGVIGGLSVGDYVGVTGIASTTTGSDVVVAPRSVADIVEYIP